ncbi:hypothetical protein BOTBODRAFT_409930 [Botryobasidium botryosum FD-172 SS1]|uniref:Fungal N-terminal domain-containing protein n=1 Tax=Botryobasidium botryosum (strain FD-172 SS1) TaxID=930990 RepID=A0A067MMF8_BOTB1|nr:hypothetical protein BOTBODRAFT_409930 [Botryobasidium botryosum FD-172 SS1]
MASAVVSVALNSLQLIYLAYTSVKNNKQRCARLVERCQLVVSRLELIVKQRGDKDLIDKIGDLEKAFKMVAVTIQRIGHQGWLRSLIHSDEDALAVEQCHRILTDLIELFNMQEIIDIGLWQKENEAARREDHQQLLQVGKGIETGNASIRDELVAQGATINQVLEIVRSMSREQQDGTVVDTPVQEPTPRRPGPHTLMDNTKSLPAIPTSINIPPPTIATPPIPIRSAPLERSNTRTRLRNSFPSLSATLMGLLTPGSSPKSGSATLVPELGFESDTATDSRNKKKKGNVLTKFKRGKSSKDVKRQDSVSQTPLDTPTQQLRFSLPEMPKRSQTDRPRPRMQPSVDSTASTADSTKSVANSSLTKASRESVRADDSPIPSVGDSPVEELQRPRLSKDTEETSEGTIRGRRPTPNLVAFPEQSRSGSRTRLSPNPSPWPDRQSSPSRLIAEVKTLGRKLGDGALLDDFGK